MFKNSEYNSPFYTTETCPRAYTNISSKVSVRRWAKVGSRKKPKFKVGDTVVITIYGTVGKITAIKKLENQYVYEINKSDGLFREHCLSYLKDYEGKLIKKETIDIHYKFYFGDIVTVNGYKGDIFKVVGFRTEIWRYKEDAWEDVIYELSRLSDGEWLEAGEEELTLIGDSTSSSSHSVSKQYELHYPIQHGEKEFASLPEKKDNEKSSFQKEQRKKAMIDRLLDAYNDYKMLYEIFQDEYYLAVLQQIRDYLKKYSSG